MLLSGHDDERLDQPIRHGQWPRTAEIVIQHLWHCCVALSVEKAKRAKLDVNKRLKLSVVASVVVIGSLAIPLLLLGGLHLINWYQFNLLWHYGAYLAVAAFGALIAGGPGSDMTNVECFELLRFRGRLRFCRPDAEHRVCAGSFGCPERFASNSMTIGELLAS